LHAIFLKSKRIVLVLFPQKEAATTLWIYWSSRFIPLFLKADKGLNPQSCPLKIAVKVVWLVDLWNGLPLNRIGGRDSPPLIGAAWAQKIVIYPWKVLGERGLLAVLE
jgi:hypothetical protein